jgi:transposase InsO family protein
MCLQNCIRGRPFLASSAGSRWLEASASYAASTLLARPRYLAHRGTCHEKAVTESCFTLLKRERIWRGTYKTSGEARQDVFDKIEKYSNPSGKHAKNGMLSSIDFERQQKMKTEGAWKNWAYSVRFRGFSNGRK